MGKDNRSKNKIFALVTYCVVVLSLVMGLILPLSSAALAGGEAINFDNMPLPQLTGAIRNVFSPNSKLTIGRELSPLYSFGLNLFGTGVEFDLGALLFLLYSVVTGLSILMLIPVCLVKRRSVAARRMVFAVEALALLPLAGMMLIGLTANSFAGTLGNWNLSVLIPFGVTLLMLVLQALVYNTGSGFVKLWLLALSFLALLFVVYPAETFLPWLTAFETKLANIFHASYGLYGNPSGVTGYYGFYFADMLIQSPAKLVVSDNVWSTVFNISAAALSILIVINFLLDLEGMAKRTNIFMLVCNVIRYSLEIAAIISFIVMLLVLMFTPGIMLYLLCICALAALITNIARWAHASKKRKHRHKQKKEEQATPAPVKEEAKKPAENAKQEPVVETRNVVYNVHTIYNGPTDNFIRKLTNDEKVEFARLFMERRTGALAEIPDYVVGGDNSKFFSSIFIYFARIRDAISDGLMDKLYNEVKAIR